MPLILPGKQFGKPIWWNAGASGADPYAPTFLADFTTASSLPAWLTHTRGSLATMTDANGYLTYCPNNLLTYSNTFSNAAWTSSGMTLTAGQPDPFGGNTATLVSGTSRLDKGLLSFVGGVNYLGTIWLKGTAGQKAGLHYFRTGSDGDLVTSLITLTGTWQQVYVAFPVTTPTPYGRFGINLEPSKGSTASSIYVCCATLSAVTYETSPRPQDQVITTSAAYYGPRINSSGLLIEESSTNLFLNSGSPATQTITVTSGQTYTVSFYGTGSITLSGAATQTMNGTGAFPTRTTYTFTAGSASLTATVSGTITYPQVESKAFATSYIPTTSASVTRAADVVQVVGSALGVLQGAQGAALVEWNPEGFASAVWSGLISGGSYPQIYVHAVGTALESFQGTGFSLNVTNSVGSKNRAGISWDTSGRSLSGNGLAPTTASGTFTGVASATLGYGPGDTSVNGYISKLALYNQRLPDATLRAKTVLGAAL